MRDTGNAKTGYTSDALKISQVKSAPATGKQGSNMIACIITDMILFISVCGCIVGLWSDPSLFAVSMIGLPVLLLRLIRFRSSRAFFIIWLAAIGATFAALIVMNTAFTGGAKLLANELFDIGESQQGYIYDRFDIGADVTFGGRYVCACILAVFLALGFLAASRPVARLLTALGLFAFCVFVCAYFGIAPVYMAIIGILVSPVLFFLAATGVSLKGFLIGALFLGAVMGATGVITWAAAPEKNIAVSETEERLRDFFSGRTLHFANMGAEDDKDKDRNDTEEKDDEVKDEGQPPGETGGSVNGVTLLFIILAIIGILAILFIPAVLLDKVKKRRAKNKEGMNSDDNAVAIRSNFMYLMRWFRYKGWYGENEFFEDAVPSIEKGVSAEYADSFKDMYELWKEAAFSDKEQSDENRECMEKFVDESVAYLWDQADFKERMKIKYKYAL